MFSKVRSDDVILLDGPGKGRVGLMEKMGWRDGDSVPRIFITNYEALLMEGLYELFHKWRPEAVIFDESQKLKSFNSKRSKAAERLANPVSWPEPLKYLLSGSAVLNGPVDIFQQYKVLDGGRTFGDNFYAFRNTYFWDRNAAWKTSGSRKYFPDWTIKEGSVEEINQKIFTKAMRVEKRSCLDLPPLIKKTIKVGMDPKQARVYAELLKDYVTFIGDDSVSASLAIVKALRLMQITSDFVTLDGTDTDGELVQHRFERTPKLDALEELLEEILPSSKVLVWAVWRENYRSLRKLFERLKVKHVEVHGGVSEKGKRDAVEQFQTDPSTRIFLGHPGSGGIGINLVEADTSIFYSRTFSLEHSLQAEARNDRGGSERHEKLTRYDIVCEGTIDQVATERLLMKEEVSAKTLKDIYHNILASGVKTA